MPRCIKSTCNSPCSPQTDQDLSTFTPEDEVRNRSATVPNFGYQVPPPHLTSSQQRSQQVKNQTHQLQNYVEDPEILNQGFLPSTAASPRRDSVWPQPLNIQGFSNNRRERNQQRSHNNGESSSYIQQPPRRLRSLRESEMITNQTDNKTRAGNWRHRLLPPPPNVNYDEYQPEKNNRFANDINTNAATGVIRGYHYNNNNQQITPSYLKEKLDYDYDADTEPLMLGNTRSSRGVMASTPREAKVLPQNGMYDNSCAIRRKPVPIRTTNQQLQLTSVESENTQFAAPIPRRDFKPSITRLLNSSTPIADEFINAGRATTQLATRRPFNVKPSIPWMQMESSSPAPAPKVEQTGFSQSLTVIEQRIYDNQSQQQGGISPVSSLDENDLPIEELKKMTISRESTPGLPVKKKSKKKRRGGK
ncbi:hypothetical protein QBC38DRAFT_520621 [Podospora fimiseda]|uniref:Uncharacterized protein n=1 Tax=Podospora fimiseda TaxID=252190 RepID=A0AAN6YQA4_9PEZI|nr:hypothetical protein QBC38DRAFT_520621 [Podospora fimiseda]